MNRPHALGQSNLDWTMPRADWTDAGVPKSILALARELPPKQEDLVRAGISRVAHLIKFGPPEEIGQKTDYDWPEVQPCEFHAGTATKLSRWMSGICKVYAIIHCLSMYRPSGCMVRC